MRHSNVKHVRLTTTKVRAMVGWYARVFGMSSTHFTTPDRMQSAARLIAAWSSNDAANPSVTLLTVSGLHVEPLQKYCQQLQRVTLACATIEDLRGACRRLKALGIEPVLTLETTFLYEDPDGNIVELKLNNLDSEGMIAACAAQM